MVEKIRLVDVAHVSKRGSSLRISIPRKVAESIGVCEGEILGFYSDGERIFVGRILWCTDILPPLNAVGFLAHRCQTQGSF